MSIGFLKEETCEDVTSTSQVEQAYTEDKVLIQKRGMLRRDKEDALKTAKLIEDGGNEHWDKGDLLACEHDIPENPETETKWHVTPEENTESITEKDGLIASPADDCENGDGVFLTNHPDAAKGWAETLGAERSMDKFALLKVEKPVEMETVKDTNPIVNQNVPQSEVACTDIGIPKRFIEKEETVEVDPGDETKMGGIGGTRYG